MKVEQIQNVIVTENITYGTVWTEEKLVSVFNISLPDLSGNASEIMRNARRYELEKMNGYISLNEQLLNIGMCIVQEKGIYRVPLISEMTSQITKYYNSSNQKLNSPAPGIVISV